MADEAGRAGAADRDTVVYGVPTDSEFVPVNWRLHHADLNALSIPVPADIKRERSASAGVLVAHAGRGAASDVPGRSRRDRALQVPDALRRDQPCPGDRNKGGNRNGGGERLQAA